MNPAEASRVQDLMSVALRDAVIAGRSDRVAVLLVNNNMDPEARGLPGNSPLFHAAGAGNSVIVGLLIAAGANVNRHSGHLQSTALHAACEDRRAEVVRQLLAAGANPTQTNGDGQTPLHSACFGGSTRVVTKLLRTGVGSETRNIFGATPLSLAVAHDHFGVVDLLLIAGADPNAPGRNAYTPLHIASAQGLFNIVVELLLAGAYPSPRHEQTEETPLFVAACAGFVDIVRSLLQVHADPSLKTNGLTPLDVATREGHAAVMREFIQYPSLLAESSIDYNTALRVAVTGHLGESEVVLPQAGVSPTLESPVWLPKSGDFGKKQEHAMEETQRQGPDDVVHQVNQALVDKGSEVSPPNDTDQAMITPPFAPTFKISASTPLLADGSDSDESSSTAGLMGQGSEASTSSEVDHTTVISFATALKADPSAPLLAYGSDSDESSSAAGMEDELSEVSTSSGIKTPFATFLKSDATTPLLVYEGDNDVSSSKGGLVSLLKGEGRCDSTVYEISRRERDPERKVRFDVPDVPAVEIVEAFPLSPAVVEVFAEETRLVLEPVLPSGDCRVLEENETNAGCGHLRGGEHQLRKEVKTLDEKVERLEKEIHQLNTMKQKTPLRGDGNPCGGTEGLMLQNQTQEVKSNSTAEHTARDASSSQQEDYNGETIPEVQQHKTKSSKKTAINSTRKRCGVIGLGQSLMPVKTISSWRRLGTLMGRLRGEPAGVRTADQSGKEAMWSWGPTQSAATTA